MTRAIRFAKMCDHADVNELNLEIRTIWSTMAIGRCAFGWQTMLEPYLGVFIGRNEESAVDERSGTQ
jgi:hypothetical protein